MNPKNIFSFDAIGKVEAKVGIYAWYVVPYIAGDDQNSVEALINHIKNFAKYTKIPTRGVEVSGSLSLALSGELNHRVFDPKPKTDTKNVGKKKETPSHSDFTSVDKVLDIPEGRVALAQILQNSMPLLAAPIYIGIAKDLSKRLQTHTKLIKQYDNCKGELTLEEMENMDNDRTFAHRVAKREIPEHWLWVGVQYVEEMVPTANHLSQGSRKNKTPEAIQREWIEAAETILNRLYHPVMGKR